MLQLTPEIKINSDRVTMVSLSGDLLGLVCTIKFDCGTMWEIRGEYAPIAWAGWMAYWKGKQPPKMKVRVPCAIIQKLKNVGVNVIEPAVNT